jgi:hypothetical protein
MSQDSLDIKLFNMYQVLTAELGLETQISVLVPLDRGLESWYLGDPGREHYYSISVSIGRRRRKGQLEVVGRSSLQNEPKGGCHVVALRLPHFGSYSDFRKTRLD